MAEILRWEAEPGPERHTIVEGPLIERRFQPVPGHWVTFQGAECRDVDFGGARFHFLRSFGSVFERCDFRRAHIDGAAIRNQSMFVDCSFENATLNQVNVGAARFERCTFSGGTIRECFSYCGEFVDCVFTGRLQGCKFFGTPMDFCIDEGHAPTSPNRFTGNDFSHADLVDVSFVGGIDLRSQSWPEDPVYRILDHFAARIQLAEREVRTWREGERLDAESILQAFRQSYSETGQETVLLREDDRVWPNDVWARVVRLLDTTSPES